VLQTLQNLIDNALRKDHLQQSVIMAVDQTPKTPGRKIKLSMETFEKEIFPMMKLQFPDSKHVQGIKAYCEAVGKKYGVGEKTIRDKFDTFNNKPKNPCSTL